VLIKRDEVAKEIGSIIIPDTVRDKERPLTGVVVATGPDVNQVFPGDKVLFGEYSGTQIAVDEMTFVIMREDDVHITIEEG
jgi:chaperonin GroES